MRLFFLRSTDGGLLLIHLGISEGVCRSDCLWRHCLLSEVWISLEVCSIVGPMVQVHFRKVTFWAEIFFSLSFETACSIELLFLLVCCAYDDVAFVDHASGHKIDLCELGRAIVV